MKGVNRPVVDYPPILEAMKSDDVILEVADPNAQEIPMFSESESEGEDGENGKK